MIVGNTLIVDTLTNTNRDLIENVQYRNGFERYVSHPLIGLGFLIPVSRQLLRAAMDDRIKIKTATRFKCLPFPLPLTLQAELAR